MVSNRSVLWDNAIGTYLRRWVNDWMNSERIVLYKPFIKAHKLVGGSFWYYHRVIIFIINIWLLFYATSKKNYFGTLTGIVIFLILIRNLPNYSVSLFLYFPIQSLFLVGVLIGCLLDLQCRILIICQNLGNY